MKPNDQEYCSPRSSQIPMEASTLSQLRTHQIAKMDKVSDLFSYRTPGTLALLCRIICDYLKIYNIVISY